MLRFEGIPSNYLSVEPLPSTCLFLELKLQKQKCLVPCSFNPNRNNIIRQVEMIIKKLDSYIPTQFENVILLGGFNGRSDGGNMSTFCIFCDLSSVVKKPRWFKVQSCKLYNKKYMIASTQITNITVLAFIAVLVLFNLLSRKVLLINRKDNRKC